MATAFYTGNGQTVAQQFQLQVTAVAVGGTLTATCNLKDIVYTCVTGDTTATAAAAWQALLAAASATVVEFGEVTWSVSGSTITAVASTPGTPVTFTSGGAGGATVTQTATVANSSPSDVGNPDNWLRSGVATLPVNGDDLVFSSATPVLWNLTALSAILANSVTRTGDQTGQVGLPTQNPAGYREYRPTHLQLASNVAQLSFQLGGSGSGGGPGLERYDLQTYRTNVTVSSSGQLDLLGSNANNTLKAQSATVNVAAEDGQAAALASATLNGGVQLVLGSGVSFSGALALLGSSAQVACTPGGAITLDSSSSLVVTTASATHSSVTAAGGSSVTWLSNSTLSALTLRTGSRFDKSLDLRAMTLTASTIDADCQVLDPNNAITYTNATTVNGAVSGGPFTFTSRTVKVV